MRNLFIIATAVGLMSACGDDQEPGEANALWERIQGDDYQNWDRAPGFEARQDSQGPHEDEVLIYLNDVAASALTQTGLDAWPEGSLIVKDGFDGGGDLGIVAAMDKRSDGWFFAEWKPNGDTLFSGKPSVCTGCHSGGSDGVLAVDLP